DRGSLMHQRCARGSMAAVAASEAELAEIVQRLGSRGALGIASINAPDQVAVSGDAALVDEACRDLAAAGLRIRPLDVSHAFHSQHMAAIAGELDAVAATLAHAPAALPVISTRWGRAAGPSEIDPSYWSAQAVSPVRFADAVRATADQLDAVIEIGPD